MGAGGQLALDMGTGQVCPDVTCVESFSGGCHLIFDVYRDFGAELACPWASLPVSVDHQPTAG